MRPIVRVAGPRCTRRITGLVGVLALCILGADQPANDPAIGVLPKRASTGLTARLVRVPLPIKGTVDTRVMRVLDQVISDLPRTDDRPIVVLEFWPPEDGDGESSEFGRALQLARHLASQRFSGVRTVAYLPRTVTGHAVLVALACEEIIMHPDAQLGAAGIREPRIDATVRSGYSEIADRRRTIPSAVALGMLDAELEVQRIKTASGTRYVLSRDLPDIQQQTTIQSIDTVIPAGEMGLLSGDRLRLDYNFVSHLAANRTELASALGIAPSQLEIDPSLGGRWKPILVELHGAVNASVVNRVMRGIEDRMREQSVNFICVSIDSPGGSPKESIRLANFLSSELDPTEVRTVAYVSHEARADAAIVAMACDQLVMTDAAVLGGSGAYEMDRGEIDTATEAIREICRVKSRRWSLPAAMIDPDRQVFRYSLKGSNVDDFLCAEELEAQPDPERWQRGEEITTTGQALRLDGETAIDVGLARFVVGDFGELLQQYQLEENPELVKPNWAHELIQALASPQVAATLLFIGGFALIAELSAPGIGVGGFVSALCFMLFFWSNFLQGTAGWLEVLLFFGGLAFVTLEIFVVPGFGVFGLGGGAMILMSLILASQTFVWPRNEYQMQQLPRSLMTVAAAFAGILTSAVLLRRYLAKAPLLNRVTLRPPEGEDLAELQRREAIVDYSHLVGRVGVTTTPLTPGGKAEIDGVVVNVMSDSEVISRGTQVAVVESAGNRVIVRAVS